MRIVEIIDGVMLESVSLASTLKLLASDIGNPVTELYSKLESMAQKYAENNDSMGGFRLLEKGVISKWLNEDGKNLISHLHHLADQAPSQSSSALRMFLREPSAENLRHMAEALTPILVKIGKDTNYEHLARNALAWHKQDLAYQDVLDRLDDYAKSDKKRSKDKTATGLSISDKYAEKKDKETAEKKAAHAKSQTQAEQLVNAVLRALPSGVAGEIRNAISRDNNKLVALKRELDRRNIKM